MKQHYIRWNNEIKKAFDEEELHKQGIGFTEFKTMCMGHVHQQMKLSYKPEHISAVDTEQAERLEKQELELKPKKLDNYLDNAYIFHKQQPYMFDKANIFWLWNNKLKFWEMIDETQIMIGIDKGLKFYGDTIQATIKNNYLEAMKRVGRHEHPKQFPKTWIQFKDKIFDIETKEIKDASADFFTCNPIPHSLGDSSHTPIMDKLFEEWVGVKYIETMYEIIAYCCLTDYPIHRIFCFVGSGRNGKTQFQKIVQKFIGNNNLSSACLDKLSSPNQRFEKSKLYKKLVCLLGETNFGTMSNTSTLKQLSGGDLIDFEFKNKNPFTDVNYATILINSNSLPSSLDTSDGFYRRWIIIDFPNEFKEGKDIIATIPDVEYNNLARKIVDILPKLLNNGCFANEGSIQERKDRYILASNPLPIFIKQYCDINIEYYARSSEIYTLYTKYLKINKKRHVKRSEFNNYLSSEGFEIRRTSKLVDGEYENTTWIEGFKIKKCDCSCVTCVLCNLFLTQKNIYKSEVKNVVQTTQTAQNQEELVQEQIIHHKCHYCGTTPSITYSKVGKPICATCKENPNLEAEQ